MGVNTGANFNFKLTDNEFTVKLNNLALAYERRMALRRAITLAQGAVAIDTTEVPNIEAVVISTDSPVDVVLNKDTITVTSLCVLVGVTAVKSIACAEDYTTANVELYVYGNA